MFDDDIEINGCGHFSMNPFEVETSGFFGKSVISNEVLLGHSHERMFYYSRHVKECFPEADTNERMFCYSRHMKGCMMFRRTINVTPQAVGA